MVELKWVKTVVPLHLSHLLMVRSLQPSSRLVVVPVRRRLLEVLWRLLEVLGRLLALLGRLLEVLGRLLVLLGEVLGGRIDYLQVGRCLMYRFNLGQHSGCPVDYFIYFKSFKQCYAFSSALSLGIKSKPPLGYDKVLRRMTQYIQFK